MQQLAQGIASLGRGEDKMLVHMTPGEVAGLQALAQRHGGSLTINPHTGLPEAGFLSSILPMVGAGIGLALAPATGGASMWAMGGGALGGMLGSSMEHKNPLLGGLMGGISGYGMSGLADALTGAGKGLIGTEMVDALGGTDVAMANTPPALQNVTPPPPTATFTPPMPSAYRPYDIGYGQNVSEFGEHPALSYNPTAKIVETAVTPLTPAQVASQNINPTMIDVLGGTDVAMANTPPSLQNANPAWGSLDAGPGASNIYAATNPPTEAKSALWEGAKQAAGAPGEFLKKNWKNAAMMAAPLITAGIGSLGKQNTLPVGTGAQNKGNIRPYTYSPGVYDPNSTQQVVSRGYATSPYFSGQGYTAQPIYAAAMGGSVPNENQFYPGANIARSGQNPTSTEIVGGYDPKLDPYTGEPVKMADGGLAGLRQFSGFENIPLSEPDQSAQPLSTEQNASTLSVYTYDPVTRRYTQTNSAPLMQSGVNDQEDAITQRFNTLFPGMQLKRGVDRVDGSSYAAGGIASLGTYAAGGKLLQGPGDGMSDSIPAVIQGEKPQRAALAQGEFVIPADVVSHLGNGSTDAGSKRLYAMMDKVRHARTGTKKQGKQINAEKFLPA